MQVRIKYRTTPVATKEYIYSNSVKYIPSEVREEAIEDVESIQSYIDWYKLRAKRLGLIFDKSKILSIEITTDF